MQLSDRQKKLLKFVKLKHAAQVRKYNAEPYWHHLISVAEIASKHVEGAIEISLCHDLLEDTSCSYEELLLFLVSNEYTKEESKKICNVVKELTDVYVKEDYPQMNRKSRKKKEAERLSGISTLGQSIKYADIIDNTTSIVENDKHFAKVYLREAMDLIDGMRKGNLYLLIDCCYSLKKGMLELKI